MKRYYREGDAPDNVIPLSPRTWQYGVDGYTWNINKSLEAED